MSQSGTRGVYLRLERGAALRNKRTGAFLLLERHEMGRPISRNNAYLEEGDVYLRIERHGRRIVASFSTDGREWAEAHAYDLDWPGQLSVGLDAVNSAFSPFKVRFEEFSVRKSGAQAVAAP